MQLVSHFAGKGLLSLGEFVAKMCQYKLKKCIKGASSDSFGYFSYKVMPYLEQQELSISLIIILKFHAFIPCCAEDNIKNMPILLILMMTIPIVSCLFKVAMAVYFKLRIWIAFVIFLDGWICDEASKHMERMLFSN